MYRKNPLIKLLQLKWLAIIIIVTLAVGYALGSSAPPPVPTVTHNVGLNLMNDGNISTIIVEADRTLLVLESPWTLNGTAVNMVEWSTHPGRNYITHALNDMMVSQQIQDQMKIEFPPLESAPTTADLVASATAQIIFLSVGIPLLYVLTQPHINVREIEDGMKVTL